METMLKSGTSDHNQEAVALKKALEWELNLDSRDLRSHAWYHGPLSRQRAEEIVQNEGDFLIRDCTSQPDNYVLTCKTKSSVLHFVINKILLQPETVYERVQYQFEDDAFDAVPDLITFYVGSGKTISAASGARIHYPCNRTYPLSFYGHKIFGNQLHAQMLAGVHGASPLNSPSYRNTNFKFTPQQQESSFQYKSPASSPPRIKRDTLPQLPSKKQRSQSLTPCQTASTFTNEKLANQSEMKNSLNFKNCRVFSNIEKHPCVDKAGHITNKELCNIENFPRSVVSQNNGFQTIARSTLCEFMEHVKFTTNSLPRFASNSYRGSQRFNRDVDILLSPCSEGKQLSEYEEKPPSPPPKPSRAPIVPRKERDMSSDLFVLHRISSHHTSGSDSGNGSGDSIQSSLPGDGIDFNQQNRGVLIKNLRFMTNSNSSSNLKGPTDFDLNEAENILKTLHIPEIEITSMYDVENYSTLLLPSIENKPLDGDALETFKMMLLEAGPKIIAEHITRVDIQLILDQNSIKENLLKCCGLEIITLPQGNMFRKDLIERTQCIKLIVAVTVLTCQTDMHRAEILSKWIQIAVDIKTALGNLFGFCAIMLGLSMPQIQQLEQVWHLLRQKFTDSAFTFEAKLRPTLKNMNNCTNPQAPNTTVPHLLVYILLKERFIEDILDQTDKSLLVSACISSWESKADDFGISINFLHLDSARSFLKNLNMFKQNAKIVIEESESRLDDLLMDAFRTEFLIKFLWGSKGALASADDRHCKLEKVLTLMSQKFCYSNNGNSSEL